MRRLSFNSHKLLLLIIFSSFGLALDISIINCQAKWDYNWVIVSNADPIPGIDAYIIDFNNGKRSLREISAYNIIHQGNAVISDRYGNLQFFTNGCEVMDTLGGVIPNGGTINPGEVYDTYCHLGFYLGIQNSTIIPDPSNEESYYYLQKKAILDDFQGNDNWPLFPSQQYSRIRSDINGGVLIEKNITIDSVRHRFSTSTESILHDNGVDWWVIDYLIEEAGGLRLTYIIDNDGVNLHREEEYENKVSLKYEYQSEGQSAFAPNGELYARYNAATGLDLFDFDRSTGEFSNYRNFPTSLQRNYSGLAFSPNSRFIYISSHDKLHQLDLWEENLEDGLQLIGEYDGFVDPLPTNFTYMQLGPDCRIYMTSTNGVSSYHVINNPDEKGLDCDFVQHGFDLPVGNGAASIPNFPVFRFDDDEVCDPMITSVFDIPVEVVYDLELHPNPTTDELIVGFPEELRDGTLYVKSMSGQVVIEQVFDFSGSLKVSLVDYDAGMYIIEVESGGKRYVDRVVKLD